MRRVTRRAGIAQRDPAPGPLSGHDGGVSAVTISGWHGRPVIVTAGYDYALRLWDLDSGDLLLGPSPASTTSYAQ